MTAHTALPAGQKREWTEAMGLGATWSISFVHFPFPAVPVERRLPFARAYLAFAGFAGGGVVATGAGIGPAFSRSFASSHCCGIVAMFWTA